MFPIKFLIFCPYKWPVTPVPIQVRLAVMDELLELTSRRKLSKYDTLAQKLISLVLGLAGFKAVVILLPCVPE